MKVENLNVDEVSSIKWSKGSNLWYCICKLLILLKRARTSINVQKYKINGFLTPHSHYSPNLGSARHGLE